MPNVSVVMGVYNDEVYIRESIESILNQSYCDFEFIICDDGSTDSSISIIKEYMKNDDRIVLLRNDKNIGLSATLNKCIAASSGNYIARMDSDDISHIDRFEKQVRFLEDNLNYSLVGTAVNIIDENNIKGIRYVKQPRTKEDAFNGNCFIHPTVMIRKAALEDVGCYTISSYTYRGQDYDLWCKLYEKGYIGYNLNDVLLDYRQDRNAHKKKNFKRMIGIYKIRKMWYKKFGLSLKYYPNVIKPLISGIIPNNILSWYYDTRDNNIKL